MKQIDELQDCLDGVSGTLVVSPAPSAAWTVVIKKALAHLGREKRYWVYATLPFDAGALAQPADGDDWLYDLCWLSLSDGRLLVDMELAMQAAWGQTDEVLGAFQKLCQARARFKLMVYHAQTEDACDQLTALLTRQRAVFARRDPTETWLLSCWVAELRGFRHRAVEAE